MLSEVVFERVNQRMDRLADIASKLWHNPELGLQEHRSSEYLKEILQEEGFEITGGVGDMPTAFVASYGEGEPHIGILGEYDALPGLSQAVEASRSPIDEDGPGHGCGHNLFAAACVEAAIAVKSAIERDTVGGKITLFGCPAEEQLVGKVFMARAGVFDDIDAALTWHPGSASAVRPRGSLALDSVEYTFSGTSAHAAVAPEAGRSGLDAVELMNVGVEYLREHVSDAARVHHVIPDGGSVPNVVPDSATVWYYIRAPTREEVDEIREWVLEIAEAAARMAQVDVSERYITGCYDYLPNETLLGVLWENMQMAGPIDFTTEDEAFAYKLKSTLSEQTVRRQTRHLPDPVRSEVREQTLYSSPVEMPPSDQHSSGSTDVGDVSWIAPTGQFTGATWPVGTPAHTWQAVAANGSFGVKGAVFAAKVLAGSTVDLLSDPARIERVVAEFESATDGQSYRSPLPNETSPPTDIISRLSK